MWFHKHDWSINNISPVTVKKKTIIKDGFPVEKISVKNEDVILNSYKVMSKLPQLSQHELEIAIGTGQNLKEVNSKILDISDNDINKIISDLNKKSNKVKENKD